MFPNDIRISDVSEKRGRGVRLYELEKFGFVRNEEEEQSPRDARSLPCYGKCNDLSALFCPFDSAVRSAGAGNRDRRSKRQRNGKSFPAAALSDIRRSLYRVRQGKSCHASRHGRFSSGGEPAAIGIVLHRMVERSAV